MEFRHVDGLEKRFTRLYREIDGGKILLPEAPIPLVEVIVCEDEEEEEYRREDPDGFAQDHPTELAGEVSGKGICFVWEGFYVWQASLTLVEYGGYSYGCINVEADLVGCYKDMWQLVACLSPGGCASLEMEFLLSCLSCNGRDYGLEFMGSLPSTFDSWGVNGDILYEGFRQAMEFGVKEYGWLWQDLLQEIQRRLDGETPRDWLLKALGGVNKETLFDELEEMYEENGQVREEAKQFILDCYFRYS